MKNKIRISALLLVSLLMSMFTYATHVDDQQAKMVAANFCQMNPSNMTRVYPRVNSPAKTFYIFQHKNGFVIVAADDRIKPILGYSNEGKPILIPKDEDTITGNNFWGLMNTYNKVINHILDNNLPGTSDITAQWSTLKHGGAKSPNVVVTPLLTTTWGQGWPYNSMCPVNPSGPGGHVWVGCVGTAMAQILRFWSNPAVGLGSFSYQSGSYPTTSANFNTSYNWANMPNSTATVNADISKIMYHTAVSTMSQWGAGGTSVIYYSGEDPMTRSFKNYFKMSSSYTSYVAKSDYTDSQWNDSLQHSLLAGRPILYDGDGSMSHTWVCDGVDNSNMYHFNFGWDGTYNGYYSLGNINPGGNVLTNNQNAIWGIKPNDGSTLMTNTTWSGTMNFTTNIWVPDSLTLTINAGAVIKFAPGCGLYVFGKLVCNGTSSNYVKLTASDTTNGWDGVRFDNNYMARLVMANNDTSKMLYTQVEYSHSSGVTCVAYGKLILEHCKINNNHGMWGAGVCVSFIPIKISYCEFYNNHALSQGGGLLVTTTDALSSSIDHNNIHNNVADYDGGGFYFMNVNNVAFVWNTSHHNYAHKGAGGAIMYGTIPLINNKICNNITPIPGGQGALYLENYSGKIVDMLIANNTAYGISCINSSPLIINTTVVNNNYDYACGMVFDANSNAIIKNCIIYGNIANNTSWGTQISLWDGNCDPYFDHCDIQGGLTSIGGPGSGSNYTTGNYTNNTGLLPQFVASSAGAGAGYDGLIANWQLQSSSPCINAGDTNELLSILPATDLGGNPRISGSTIDIGGYEYQAPQAGFLVDGVVRYDNGAGTLCAGVQVCLCAGVLVLDSTFCNAFGVFSFTNVAQGNYTLRLSSQHAWGGVNATDALTIMKHFVGMSVLTGVRLLAAELNGDGIVNSIDAMMAMKRFVGLQTSFATGNWRFEQPEVQITGNTSLNVKGLCNGDVDGSYTP